MVDHYKPLQVSASADAETIHRVYRLLAQRYHPDNPDTGNATAFHAERRKRAGVLSTLYAKRIENPGSTGLAFRDLEELLGCPGEHLDFTTWHLRQKGLIRDPDGRQIRDHS